MIGVVRTAPEELENGRFTLERIICFPEEFFWNATFTVNFRFVFEENSVL